MGGFHLEDIISTVRTDKACRLNSIPTRILKDFKKELPKPLSDVIDISFSFGIFPNSTNWSKLYLSTKKTTNLTATTTDQSPYYPT